MTSATRRFVLIGLLLPTAAPFAFASRMPTKIEVWKDPNCGCCKDWIRHLEANGFSATVFETGNSDIRAKMGLPVQLGSCHTARVDGYVIEGHVPAREIRRLLRERPEAIGLAVPSMPLGSPGMDGPAYQGRKTPFDVLLVRKDGHPIVFQPYR